MKTAAVLCRSCLYKAVSPSGNLIGANVCCRSRTGNSGVGMEVIYDVVSQKRIIELPESISALAFSPDEKLLLFDGGKTGLGLWSIETKEVVKRFDGQRAERAIFSPDGLLLASEENKTLTIRDMTSGNVLFTVDL
jgi:WD40 repeat protein